MILRTSTRTVLDRATSGLRYRYIAALSIVAVLSISGQILIQYALDRQFMDTWIVNVAGRQRMLSQRLCKTALRLTEPLSYEEHQERYSELSATLEEWSRVHDELSAGSSMQTFEHKNSPAVQAKFLQIQDSFMRMREAGVQFLKIVASEVTFDRGSARHWVNVLFSHERDFLEGMNEIVYLYDQEGQARVSTLRKIEGALLAFTLLTLLLEGILVFKPAENKIASTLQQLYVAERTLSDKNKILEKALAEAEIATQYKSQFMANVSHEIRTPLHAILGMTELMQLKTQDGDSEKQLGAIRVSAGHLQNLIDELLDFSRLEAGKLSLHLTEVSLSQLISECRTMLYDKAQKKALELRFELQPQLPELFEADAFRLRQVLLNLIGNAIKFTERGKIVVTVSATGPDKNGSLLFSVADTGPGVPTQKHSSIFEAFTQVDYSASRRHEGVGLGLAICKELVALMGGSIRLENNLPQGSIFSFSIPLIHTHAAKPLGNGASSKIRSRRIELPISLSPSQKLRTILAVEDNEINLELLQAQLRRLGYRVLTAKDGNEALQLLDTEPVDLILMDGQMPGMDGYRTAQSIRDKLKNYAQIPIIGVTAHAMNGDRERCLEFGMDDYLSKPVSLTALSNKLRTWLDDAEIEIVQTDEISVTDEIEIDYEVLKRIQRLQSPDDPELAADMVALFLRKTQLARSELISACNSGDLERFARVIHGYRSSAGSLGAVAICELCRQAEMHASSGATMQAFAMLPELLSFMDRACIGISSWFDDTIKGGKFQEIVEIENAEIAAV